MLNQILLDSYGKLLDDVAFGPLFDIWLIQPPGASVKHPVVVTHRTRTFTPPCGGITQLCRIWASLLLVP